MKMEISYAAMSYLRDLVRKDQLEYFRTLPWNNRHHTKNISSEEMQKIWDNYWKFHDMTPQVSKESCMVAILKECDRVEDECKKELGLK